MPTWYVYQHFLVDFQFDEICVRLLFFTLGRFFTSEQTIPQLNETVKQDKIREEPENRKAERAKRPSAFFALKASS